MALVAGACYGQPRYVVAEQVEPLQYGLFSIAQWPDTGDAHWQQGVEWEPAVCGPASIYACPTCDQNNNNTEPEKTYEDGPGSDIAMPFTVYGSFVCSPVGNWDRAEMRARQLLENGGERAVELAIANGSSHTSKALQDATSVDITPTPGTPVTPLQGMALLEAYIGANGAGEGAIIGNRRDILLAASEHILERRDSGLYTMVGTPVAAVAGWDGRTGPNNDAAGTGQAWLFALGSRPRIWRSDVFMTPPSRNNGLDTANNNLAILAEQTYAVGWDCFTAGVLVSSV
jgi:hypothetical protein